METLQQRPKPAEAGCLSYEPGNGGLGFRVPSVARSVSQNAVVPITSVALSKVLVLLAWKGTCGRFLPAGLACSAIVTNSTDSTVSGSLCKYGMGCLN